MIRPMLFLRALLATVQAVRAHGGFRRLLHDIKQAIETDPRGVDFAIEELRYLRDHPEVVIGDVFCLWCPVCGNVTRVEAEHLGAKGEHWPEHCPGASMMMVKHEDVLGYEAERRARARS